MSNTALVQVQSVSTEDILTAIFGSESFKLKYITDVPRNRRDRGTRMNIEFIQFLFYVILSIIEILFEVQKALGLIANRKHDGPFGEIINEWDEIT